MQPKIDIDAAARDAAKLLELEARATKGPWTNSDGKRKPGKSIFIGNTAHERTEMDGSPSRYGPRRDYIANFLANYAIDVDDAIANTELVCAMRNSIADLARAVIVLREALSEIKLVHMVDTQEFIHEATRRLFGDAEKGGEGE